MNNSRKRWIAKHSEMPMSGSQTKYSIDAMNAGLSPFEKIKAALSSLSPRCARLSVPGHGFEQACPMRKAGISARPELAVNRRI